MREPTRQERLMRALRHVLVGAKALCTDYVGLPVLAFNGTRGSLSAGVAVEGRQPWLFSFGTSTSLAKRFAPVIESQYEVFQSVDWRSVIASRLHGKGVEIGALHRPLLCPNAVEMDYIDRLSYEDLRSHYAELQGLDLVRPTIVSDAETLTGVSDNAYDFLVSAHIIEHMRDPIGAIVAWARVVRPGGFIYLIVPDARGTFDRYRERTSLEHMIMDYYEPSVERDYLHYLEYSLFVHDRVGDAAIEDADKLVADNYSIHYHVFLPSDMTKLVEWMSKNVSCCSIAMGPVSAPGSDEFHFLIKVH